MWHALHRTTIQSLAERIPRQIRKSISIQGNKMHNLKRVLETRRMEVYDV